MKNIVDDLSSIANPILRKKRSAKKGKKARSNIDVAKSNVVKDVKIDLSKIFETRNAGNLNACASKPAFCKSSYTP